MSEIEAEAMNLNGENIVKVNFKESKKIAENIFILPAYGHIKGNSMVVAEFEGIHYIFHGDVTYTDEALRQNALSVVFEDKNLAKDTLDNVENLLEKIIQF